MTDKPDSPCIAVCTTLYDDFCKGCGRTYYEVALWTSMSEADKKEVWDRIDTEATSWRYNRYKDRADTNQPKENT
jgi:hypothetical protein